MLKTLLQGPAMKPPPGEITEFGGGPGLESILSTVEILFFVLPTLTVLIR